MKKIMISGSVLFFAHCMAIQVPEDYVADVYYGQPKLLSVSASASSTSLSAVPIQITFSNPMDAASVIVNTTDTACTGTLQASLASDNFTTTCLRFAAAPTSATRDSVFTATLFADVLPNSNYIVRALGTITDFRGTSLGTNQDMTFKAGVPPGQEPAISISVPKNAATTTLFRIIGSRQMNIDSIINALSIACNSSSALIILTDDSTGACINSTTLFPNTAGGFATNLDIGYPNLQNGKTYTMVVRPGILDEYGISTIATTTQAASLL